MFHQYTLYRFVHFHPQKACIHPKGQLLQRSSSWTHRKSNFSEGRYAPGFLSSKISVTEREHPAVFSSHGVFIRNGEPNNGICIVPSPEFPPDPCLGHCSPAVNQSLNLSSTFDYRPFYVSLVQFQPDAEGLPVKQQPSHNPEGIYEITSSFP